MTFKMKSSVVAVVKHIHLIMLKEFLFFPFLQAVDPVQSNIPYPASCGIARSTAVNELDQLKRM